MNKLTSCPLVDNYVECKKCGYSFSEAQYPNNFPKGKKHHINPGKKWTGRKLKNYRLAVVDIQEATVGLR